MAKKISFYFFSLLLFQLIFINSCAQQIKDSLLAHKIEDSTIILNQPHFDSSNTSTKSILSADTSAKKYNPRIATLRSAIIPGWGQATNKKYWKIPIVYGALGTTAAIFFYNLKTYKQLKQAYIYKSDADELNDTLINSQFRNLSPESIRSYRNSFRQNVDYSVLFFLVFWGLNIVDATVDAHLKQFDVSNDISLKIKPALKPGLTGISFVFTLNNNKTKNLSSFP